ncbi:hypothetical protein CAAN1_25S01486 [[Candida] anglica]|uniref:Zinc-ribbon 15 domain-containing protein n=1 Tax=[Candida] anglica TaxID=148631 RepID=A0ABP0EGB9_9ASCO
MFFLIGLKEFNKPLKEGGNVSCYCGNCHNQSAHAIRTINCVSLFFIPILPFYFSKRLKCSICGASADIDSGAISRLKNGQPVAIS